MVSANLSHSCGRFDLEDLFDKKDPIVRTIFDRYREIVESCGPVLMIPQKTRIVFMVRMRFAAVYPMKRTIRLTLVLRRRLPRHPRLERIETFGPDTELHTFRLEDPSDIDPSLRRWTRESYRRGHQDHLFADGE